MDEPDFQDHSPGQGTRHVGEVASEVVNDIGRFALGHWLAQADKAENDDARTAALEADAEIARGMATPRRRSLREESIPRPLLPLRPVVLDASHENGFSSQQPT